MQKVILASQSPRRIELLRVLFEDFEVIPADIDESSDGFSSPKEYVLEMARRKAKVVAKEHPKEIVIASDTIVAFEDEILGKPLSRSDSKQMLERMSGKTHKVMTSLVIQTFSQTVEKIVETTVEFFELTKQDIDEYVASGEADDKAGAYGIQGKACVFVKEIHGDYLAIVGFPIGILKGMLKELEVSNE